MTSLVGAMPYGNGHTAVEESGGKEEKSREENKKIEVSAKSGSTMSLSNSVDSWADDLSFYGDALDLDLNAEGGFEWDVSDGLHQETNVETSVVEVEDIFKEEKTMIPTETEAIPQQQQSLLNSSVARPPVAQPIVPPEIQVIEASGLPKFTAQDEMIEQATLTTPEMIDIVSDLHGITAGLSNLQIRPPRPVVLLSLEDEMCKLPAEQTAAYCQALLKCPGLVSDKRKMAFVERENGDPALAAVRLALYWELRLDLFGPEKCFLPMTLNGAMKEEVVSMVRWRVHQLLPKTDTAGRAIWYHNVSRRDLDNYSVEQELRAVWYIFEVAMEDPEVLKQGIVLVTNSKDSGMKHYQSKEKPVEIPAKRFLIFEDAMPIRVRALHFCQPSLGASYFLPLILQIIGRKYRLRLKMHRGSEAQVLQELETFCLPRDRLPTDLGGEVVVDMAKFLAERMTLESTRADPRRVLDQKPISTKTGPTSKRARKGSVSSKPIASAEANALTKADLADLPIVSTKGIADPRMAEAVEIRLANAKMPLKEVLLKAGFTFNFEDEQGEPIGPDRVSLTQRRNNLCRRVRQEKKRRAVEGASPAEAGQSIAQDVPVSSASASQAEAPQILMQDVQVVPAPFALADLPLDAAPEVVSSTRSTLPTFAHMFEESNDDSDSVHSSSSGDSFYDAILEVLDRHE